MCVVNKTNSDKQYTVYIPFTCTVIIAPGPSVCDLARSYLGYDLRPVFGQYTE